MRILVFGSPAFAARRLADILQQEPGRTVSVAGEGGGPRFSPEDASTYDVLDGFDCVVDCGAGLLPESLLRHCLERPLTFVQMGVEPDALERRLLRRRRAAREPEARGTVVLGLGLTPGLTNLMARELLREVGSARRLEVGLRFRGVRGLLPGLLGLVAHPPAGGAARYESGERVDIPGLGPATRLPFPSGEAGAVRVPLAEALMLHWSTGVPDTATYLALPTPLLPPLLGRGVPALRRALPSWVQVPTLVREGMREARGLVEAVPIPVELTVIANRSGEQRGAGAWLSLRVDDLARASAFVVSAALALLEGGRRRPGLLLPDELLAFDEVLEQVGSLAAGPLRIEVQRETPSSVRSLRPVPSPAFRDEETRDDAPTREVG